MTLARQLYYAIPATCDVQAISFPGECHPARDSSQAFPASEIGIDEFNEGYRTYSLSSGDKGMPFPKHVNTLPTKLLSALLFCFLAAATFAQNPAPQTTEPTGPPLTPLPQAPAPQRNAHPYSDQDYSRGKKQWPNPFVVYTVREVAPLNVANSGRIDSLLIDGKLYLSLNDAVAMALEDNLDIGIQRYNLSIADTDVLRTSSGAGALGVNAGLVQGTPGGTTGT